MSEEVLTRKKAIFRILPVVIAIVIIILVAVIFASIKTAAPNPTISDKDSDYLTIGSYKVSKERLYTYLKKDYGVSELARLIDTELLKDTIQELNSDTKHTKVLTYIYDTLFSVEFDETKHLPLDFSHVEGYAEDPTEVFDELKDSLVLYGYLDEADRNDVDKFLPKMVEYFTLDAARKEFAVKHLEEQVKELGIEKVSDSEIKKYYEENYTGSSTGIFIPFLSVDQAKEVMSKFDINVTEKGLKEKKWVHSNFDYNKPEGEGNVKRYFTTEETINAFVKMYNYVMGEVLPVTFATFDETTQDRVVLLKEADLESIRNDIFNSWIIADEPTSNSFRLPTSVEIIHADDTKETATISWEITKYSSTTVLPEEISHYITRDTEAIPGFEKFTINISDITSTSASFNFLPTITYKENTWKSAKEGNSDLKIKIVCSKETMEEGVENVNSISPVIVNSYISDVNVSELDSLKQSEIISFNWLYNELNSIDSKLGDYLKNESSHLVASTNDVNFSKSYTISPVAGTNYSFLMLKLSEQDSDELLFESDDDYKEKTEEEIKKSDAIKAAIRAKLLEEDKLETNDISKVLYENRTLNNFVIFDRYMKAVYEYNYNYFFETTLGTTDYLKVSTTDESNKTVVASIGYGDDKFEITADQLYKALESHYGVMVAAQFVDDYALLSNEKYNDIYNPYTDTVLNKEEYQQALSNEVANVKKNFEYGYFTNSQLAQYGFIPAFPSSYGWNNFKQDYFGAFSDSELTVSGVFGGTVYAEAQEIFSDELMRDAEKIKDEIKALQDRYYSVDVMNLVISLDEDFDGSPDLSSESWTDEKIALAKELGELFVKLAPFTGKNGVSGQMTELVSLYNKAGFEGTELSLDEIRAINNKSNIKVNYVNYFSKYIKAGLRVKWETSNTYTNTSSIVEEFSDELRNIYNACKAEGLLDKTLKVPYLVLNEGNVEAFSTEYGYHLIYVTKATSPENVLEGEALTLAIEKSLYKSILEKNQPEDYDSNVTLTEEEQAFVESWYNSAVDTLQGADASGKAMLAIREGLANNGTIKFAENKNLEKYNTICKIIAKSYEEK